MNKEKEKTIIIITKNYGKCPVCGNILHPDFYEDENYNYCTKCGQKLKKGGQYEGN